MAAGHKHLRYDAAEVVVKGLVLGEEATQCRIWQVGAGQPKIVAEVAAVKKFRADISAAVTRI